MTCGACACSTMFLSGPWTHLKKMMEKGRIVATVIYFLSMFLTLFCAIHVRIQCLARQRPVFVTPSRHCAVSHRRCALQLCWTVPSTCRMLTLCVCVCAAAQLHPDAAQSDDTALRLGVVLHVIRPLRAADGGSLLGHRFERRWRVTQEQRCERGSPLRRCKPSIAMHRTACKRLDQLTHWPCNRCVCHGHEHSSQA